MRNYNDNPITRAEKIDWLNDQYNSLKDTNPDQAMIVYVILRENVIGQQSKVLKLA